jgi:hypothetical protein
MPDIMVLNFMFCSFHLLGKAPITVTARKDFRDVPSAAHVA